MLPNFVNAEYLLTDKLTYQFSEPRRGMWWCLGAALRTLR